MNSVWANMSDYSVLRIDLLSAWLMRMRFWSGVFLLLVSYAASATQVSDKLSATQAYELAQVGEITLIDIRRPEEWRQTGVAQGVKRINMLHPQGAIGFAQAVYAAAGSDLDAPIVLICRTGSRTSRLVPLLAEMGFTNVTHVPEGMLGSRAGPGWIARGLPIDACKDC